MKLRGRDLLGIVLAIIGIVLIVIGIMTPEIGSGGIRGMGSSTSSYDLANLALIGAGAGMVVGGLWLLIDRHKYVPLQAEKEQVVHEVTVQAPNVATPDKPNEVNEENITESDYLVLRLLNGDEREMYRAIVDAGGMMLQKDLIVKLKWSDAKVSRTIDKLIEKRVVSKERYGSTNRVKIDLTYDRE